MKLSQLYLKTLWALMLLALAVSVWADTLPNSYQSEVPVASHSPADWDKAVAPALQQVLTKMSGNPNIIQLDVVKRSLAKAGNFVQSYNYITGTTPGALSLQIRFSPKGVDDLLQTANQTGVSAKPPLTLVWLAVQDAKGQPKILTDPNDATVADFQQQANQNNVPLLWPTGDLQDISSVSANQVWQLDQTSVQQASQRYRADRILLGRIQQQVDGSWQGDWVVLSRQGNAQWQTQGHLAQTAAAVVAKLAAGNLAETSAGLPVSNAVAQQISMKVVGINGLNDYTALINYLRSLPSVADASTTQMQGDQVVLTVDLRTSQDALASEINQSGKLTLVNGQNNAIPTYQWSNGSTAPSGAATNNTVPAATTITDSSSSAQSFPVTGAPFKPDVSSNVPEEVSP